MVYDDQLKSTVLLDGYHRPDGTPEYGDVWTWDGVQWQIIPDKGPLMRFGSSAAFDSKRKKLVLFGGLNANGRPGDGTMLNDTWEWDPVNKWKKLEVAAPTGRAWHSMVYDSYRNKTVLFGGATGFGQTAFAETWEWDGSQWQKITITNGPKGLCDLAMVFDSRTKRTILFGGQNVKADEDESRKDSGETWSWDGQIWQKLSDRGPVPRTQHRMVFDSKSATVLPYGGNCKKKGAAGYTIMDDMWSWNGKQWIEIKMNTVNPGKRCMHAMAYDLARNKTILYGGGNGEILFGDTWEWNGRAWQKMADE